MAEVVLRVRVVSVAENKAGGSKDKKDQSEEEENKSSGEENVEHIMECIQDPFF